MSDLLDKMTPTTKGKTVKDVLGTVHNALSRCESQFAKVLPDILPAQKFVYQCYTYVRKNPHLWECDPNSLVAACMEAAQLGLDFNIRNQCFIVPYSGKASFQLGYKGVVELCLRHPHVQSLHAYSVHKEDTFEVELGSNPRILHKPVLEQRGEIIAFYAVATDHKGNAIPEVMTVAEVEAWAKRYVKASKGPFADIKQRGRNGENFEAYGLKTVLLRLCNRKLPMSAELSQAIEDEFETQQTKIESAIDDEAFWNGISQEAEQKIEQHLAEEAA